MDFKTSMLPFLFLFLFIISAQSKSSNPYKVLGVEKTASPREIQKAFHKLSLQYHPDKNKNKGAQQKFTEISNAYEILSGGEKRKNYDLYGDEKRNPGFSGGNGGSHGGYTHFTGSGSGGFSSSSDKRQNMGWYRGQGSFSFSFGGFSYHKTFEAEYVVDSNWFLLISVVLATILYVLISFIRHLLTNN